MSEPSEGSSGLPLAGWRARWPAIRRSWIVHESEDLLVLNKPEGVAGPNEVGKQPHSVVERGRRYLEEAGGQVGPLGVHHHLSIGVSGLLVLGRTKAGNRHLSQAFEARTVQAQFVVGVEGWPQGRESLTLQADTRRQRGGRKRGRSRVLKAKLTRVAECGSRSLVRVTAASTNPVAILGLLRAEGFRVAGDERHGGAFRLMMHLQALTVPNPGAGPPVVYRSKQPAAFNAWLEGTIAGLQGQPRELLEHLESVMERRWQRLHDADASSGRAAFRWVHREADGVPGLALDVYGDHVVMHVYEVERTGAAQELADEIVQMGFAGVYLKRRPLRANELGGEERSVVAPSDPLAGEAAEDVEVCENGVTYQVALGDGLSTGLFLDQRRNRRRLMSLAEGSSILNLFAYTGAFSVAAAHAGARETVSVDASRRALDRAERMLESFGEGHRVVKADVFRFLESSKDFDVVIVDPPTHSTVEGNRWRSGAEWTELASQCARRVASSGWLVACSNDSRMTGGTFTRRLEEGVHAAGRVIEEIDHELPEGDFPPHPSRGCHLKSVWMRLR